ncbi:MAG: protein kinase [Planctomycetota bacterium]|jgi:serine/threonine protein kinase|nr:protein kinase [Planctomycetota bacterium]
MPTGNDSDEAAGSSVPGDTPTRTDHPSLPGAREGLPPLEQLGAYRIIRSIGWGGMGIVYEAEDTRNGDRVALKLLRFSDPNGVSLRRFEQEAEATRKLDHPNIVGLREVGREGAYDFFTMDLVRGTDFTTWIQQDRPQQSAVISALATVARALEHAHQRGILHRDLKPSNLLITKDGTAYVTDFGLARAIGAESSLTATDQAVGTPQYMSPEQARGQHQDCGPSSDVWSIGVMLYEAVTGRAPFSGETILEVMQAVVTKDPPLPRKIAPEVPPPLARIALQCLQKRPQDRYPSAAALAEDLERYLAGVTVQARRFSTWTRAIRWTRRRVRAITLVALALVAAVGITVVATQQPDRDPGRWVVAWEWDCTTQNLDDVGIVPVHGDERVAVSKRWEQGSEGLLPQRAAWCWLDQVQVVGDVRIEVEVLTAGMLDGVELALGSERHDMATWCEVPRGYSCQFSGYAGSLCFISRNEQPMTASFAHGRSSPLRPGQRYRLGFERIGETLSIDVDGERLLQADYPLPLAGADMGNLGFRFYAEETELLSVRVMRLAGLTASDPLALPEAALRLGRFDEAVAGFNDIANAYSGELAARALARAYLAALQLPEFDLGQLAALRRRLFADHDDSPSALSVLEVEAAQAWAEQDFASAWDLIDACFARSPRTQVMYRIIETPQSPPQGSGHRYLGYLGQTHELRSLRVSRMGITDLSPLANLDLEWIEADNNAISDLSPLTSKQVVWLHVAGNQIQDLEPVRGMPLFSLRIDRNPVASLEPLRGMPLSLLDISRTQVTDLSPLRGMHLTSIAIDGVEPLPDLEPLMGMPVHRFAARGDDGRDGRFDCRVLVGMPLQTLHLNGRLLEHPEVLAELPLWQFGARSCGLARAPALAASVQVADLGQNPITDISALPVESMQRLVLDRTLLRDVSRLHGVHLEALVLRETDVSDVSLVPVVKRLNLIGAPVQASSVLALKPSAQLVCGDSERAGVVRPGFAPGALATVIAGLEAQQQRPETVRALRALQAWRAGDSANLRSLALASDGGACLYLPLNVSFERAVEIAKQCGARLATMAQRGELASAGVIPRGDHAWVFSEAGEPKRWSAELRKSVSFYASTIAGMVLVWDE